MTAFRVSGMLVWLTVLWVALWGDLSVANVLSGLIISLVVLAVAHQPRLTRRGTEDEPAHLAVRDAVLRALRALQARSRPT